jgi:hypothetical protein
MTMLNSTIFCHLLQQQQQQRQHTPICVDVMGKAVKWLASGWRGERGEKDSVNIDGT